MKYKLIRVTSFGGDFYVRTKNEKGFRPCNRILAAKLKWFSTKRTLFDYESGERIVELKYYNPHYGKVFDMDIDSYHGFWRVYGYPKNKEEMEC